MIIDNYNLYIKNYLNYKIKIILLMSSLFFSNIFEYDNIRSYSKIDINHKIYKNYYGGILLEDNIYGKCILPNTPLHINNKKITISNFSKNFIDNLPEPIANSEKWYEINDSKYVINSYNYSTHKLEVRKIERVYCQYIREKIKVIELENGNQIASTLVHKFLKYKNNNDNYEWDNNLSKGDYIIIQKNNNTSELDKNKIINIKLENYEGYVYDLEISDTHNYVANNILCHNTTKPILTPKIKKTFSLTNKNYHFNNLVICHICRIPFYKNIKFYKNIIDLNSKHDIKKIDKIKKKDLVSCNIIVSYNLLSLLPNKILNNKFNQILLDYLEIGAKFKWDILLQLKSKVRWAILNYYKYIKEDVKIANNIINFIISSEIKLKTKTSKLFFKNKTKLDNNYENFDTLLEFNEEERKNYDNYISKFEKIYLENNIDFTNDEYLQKYCCYPQQELDIKFFSLHNSDNSKLEEKSKKIVSALGKYKNTFLQSLHKSDCNICMNPINKNNLGITNCGHVFCYSCLYKSMKYQSSCPTCRKPISADKIFLYLDNNLDVSNSHIPKHISYMLDNLGTKISNLIKLVYQLKEKIIILSNYQVNLEKIKNILENLHFKCIIMTPKISKKILEDSDYQIFLFNYNYNFYKIDKISSIKYIICNEPNYQQLNKFNTLISLFSNVEIYNLIIKDTIEEKVYLKQKKITTPNSENFGNSGNSGNSGKSENNKNLIIL